MLPLAPFKTNTLLLSRRSRRRGFCFSGRPSALKMPGTHACSRPRCHATLLTLALHMQQDRRLHRRAAVVLLRSAAYGGGARQRVLLSSSLRALYRCNAKARSRARHGRRLHVYIHTASGWMPCPLRPVPQSRPFRRVHPYPTWTAVWAPNIYIDMVLFFLNEEFRGGRTSFPDLTTPFVYVNK